MAAIAGFESSMRVGPIGPSPPSLSALGRAAAIAFRSAPAQKVPPAPVSTATCSVSSASKDRKASASAAAVAASTALRASGRLMVTVRMESLRLVSTDGISIHLPRPAQRPNLTVTVCHAWRLPQTERRLGGLTGLGISDRKEPRPCRVLTSIPHKTSRAVVLSLNTQGQVGNLGLESP